MGIKTNFALSVITREQNDCGDPEIYSELLLPQLARSHHEIMVYDSRETSAIFKLGVILMQDNQSAHLVIVFLVVLSAINLFILDIFVFNKSFTVRVSDVSVVKPSSVPTSYTDNQDSQCPVSCLNIINEATKSSSSIGSTIQTVTDTSLAEVSAPREYYIPLGSGSTGNNTFKDLTATETVIDPGNYGAIKEAYFIASLSNPTRNGQVEAQLFNATDNHPVWGSHIIMNGPVSQTITSNKITLDRGSKLYRVQLKSSLSFDVSLDNAKIRIISD